MEPTSSGSRPMWMIACALICLIALLLSAPRDLFFQENRGVEVWLGFEVRGWLAILTAPVHWAIFGVGAWAFWTRRFWVVPWAAAYLFYVAISHLIWSEASPNGRGWPIGLAQAIGISVVGVSLLRARTRPKRAA